MTAEFYEAQDERQASVEDIFGHTVFMNINNINTWPLRSLLVLAKLTQSFVIPLSDLEVLIEECLVAKYNFVRLHASYSKRCYPFMRR